MKTLCYGNILKADTVGPLVFICVLVIRYVHKAYVAAYMDAEFVICKFFIVVLGPLLMVHYHLWDTRYIL